jgi:hypothetical protein
MGEPGKQYVRDRYDNNLRYIDDQLARFLGTLDLEDTVIVLADYGEEFWDYDDFEHGHTLYDELIHIPMIASGPGFSPGRHTEPVSMLDVAPSLAHAAGVDDIGMSGMPLQDFAEHREAFADRPQAFGRPLYGSTIWGALQGGEKYITREGEEMVFDILTDPTEQADILDAARATAGREAMAAALQTEVHIGYRLTAKRSSRGSNVTARLEVPGGVAAAWAATDPTQGSRSEAEIVEESARLTWLGNTKRTGEIFVVPREPIADVTEQTQLLVRKGNEEVLIKPGRLGIPLFESRSSIFSGPSGKTRVTMGYAVVPLPSKDDTQLDATSDENCSALLALGYVESCD